MIVMTAVVESLSHDALERLPAALAALVPEDPNAFMSALELSYLAASADGLDDKERDQIAHTLERVTGIGFPGEAFAEHFADLDESCEMFGRRERLARTAADFDTDESRADAIRFAALVAMADGTLHAHELAVLDECGSHFKWSAQKIRAIVSEVAASVRGAR
jgi:tellurite resistance protein